MSLAEKLVVSTTRSDGNCHPAVIWVVRIIIRLMWICHDAFFAPVFGPGDGSDDAQIESKWRDVEKSGLEKLEPRQ